MKGIVTSRDYEGLTLEEATKRAEQNGLNTRIVEQDGKSLMLTLEVKRYRINFRVKDGIIIEAYAG